MKKLIALCVCFILVLCAASAFARTDITSDQAIAIARAKESEFDPLEENEQRLYLYRAQREYGTDNWLVTVSVPCRDEMVDFYILTISPDGELIQTVIDPLEMALNPERSTLFLAVKKLTAERGPWYTWTIEQRVEFEAQFGTGDYRMPTQDDLTEKQAIDIAAAALQKAAGLSDEALASLLPVANLNGQGPWKDHWSVLFYIPDHPLGLFGTRNQHQVQVSNPDGEVKEVFLSGAANG